MLFFDLSNWLHANGIHRHLLHADFLHPLFSEVIQEACVEGYPLCSSFISPTCRLPSAPHTRCSLTHGAILSGSAEGFPGTQEELVDMDIIPNLTIPCVAETTRFCLALGRGCSPGLNLGLCISYQEHLNRTYYRTPIECNQE